MRSERELQQAPLTGMIFDIADLMKYPDSPLRKEFEAAMAKRELLAEVVRYQTILQTQQAILERQREDATLLASQNAKEKDEERFREQIERNIHLAQLQQKAILSVDYPQLMPEVTRFVMAVANLNSIVQRNLAAHANNQAIRQTWAAHRKQYARHVVNQFANFNVVLPGNANQPSMTLTINLDENVRNEMIGRLERRQLAIDVVKRVPHVNEAYQEEVKIQEEKLRAERATSTDTEEERTQIREEAEAIAQNKLNVSGRESFLDEINIIPVLMQYLKQNNPEFCNAAKANNIMLPQYLSTVLRPVLNARTRAKDQLANLTNAELIDYLTKKRTRNDITINETNRSYWEQLKVLQNAFDTLMESTSTKLAPSDQVVVNSSEVLQKAALQLESMGFTSETNTPRNGR